jgi:GntR family transcriptional regulator
MISIQSPSPIQPLSQGETMGFRPLYQQVRDTLTKRIVDGIWRSGDMVPSEFQIAAELGVSQGTIRKALDEMTAANLLVRRQGKGTFVASHDEARILFQFFKLKPDSGAQIFPESEVLQVKLRKAQSAEIERLTLEKGASVILITRVRSLAGSRCIVENICLPQALFDGLQQDNIPNNLYQLYAVRFGITIAGGEESLKAVAAPADVASVLNVAIGSPLLLIDRIATSLDGRAVEWRRSYCTTEQAHYAIELR